MTGFSYRFRSDPSERPKCPCGEDQLAAPFWGRLSYVDICQAETAQSGRPALLSENAEAAVRARRSDGAEAARRDSDAYVSDGHDVAQSWWPAASLLIPIYCRCRMRNGFPRVAI